MFALFFSLYAAMFKGTWNLFSFLDITNFMKPIFNALGTLLTSMFNNVETPYTTLGDVLAATSYGEFASTQNWLILVAFVLALITSIGIVVVATKGIKKLFTVFFYGVR